MFSNIQTTITAIIAVIVGLAIGFLVGEIRNIRQINSLERELDNAVLAKNNMREQWGLALDELNKTRVLLNDTLAALEVLRQYQVIDNETKREIDELEETLDPEGKPTQETYEKFKNLVDRMDRMSIDYNEMITGAVMALEEDRFDIRPFVELRYEASDLFKEAIGLVLRFRGE